MTEYQEILQRLARLEAKLELVLKSVEHIQDNNILFQETLDNEVYEDLTNQNARLDKLAHTQSNHERLISTTRIKVKYGLAGIGAILSLLLIEAAKLLIG